MNSRASSRSGPTLCRNFERVPPLDVLKSTEVYTQVPGSNPSAERHSGVPVNSVADLDDPAPGKAVFSLVTGMRNGVEGSLGRDSAGRERLNTNPCP